MFLRLKTLPDPLIASPPLLALRYSSAKRQSSALTSVRSSAAATDALKKCATFLGVGLHLYAKKPLRSAPPATASPPRGRDAPAVQDLRSGDRVIRGDLHVNPALAVSPRARPGE